MGVFQKVVESDFAKFKWEFLRRNKSYCEDWKKLKNRYKKSDLVQNRIGKIKKSDLFILPKKDKDGEPFDCFCSKWEIKLAFNPTIGYDDIFDAYLNSNIKNFKHFPIERLKDMAEWSVHSLMFPESIMSRPILVGEILSSGATVPVEFQDSELSTNLDTVIHQNYSDKFYEKGIIECTINLNYSKKS